MFSSNLNTTPAFFFQLKMAFQRRLRQRKILETVSSASSSSSPKKISFRTTELELASTEQYPRQIIIWSRVSFFNNLYFSDTGGEMTAAKECGTRHESMTTAGKVISLCYVSFLLRCCEYCACVHFACKDSGRAAIRY